MPLLRVFNSFIKNILKKQNFKEWGRSLKYYNQQVYKTMEKDNLLIYQGYVLKVDSIEKGLSLLVNPSNRIIRNDSLFDIYYYLSEENP